MYVCNKFIIPLGKLPFYYTQIRLRLRTKVALEQSVNQDVLRKIRQFTLAILGQCKIERAGWSLLKRDTYFKELMSR